MLLNIFLRCKLSIFLHIDLSRCDILFLLNQSTLNCKYRKLLNLYIWCSLSRIRRHSSNRLQGLQRTISLVGSFAFWMQISRRKSQPHMRVLRRLQVWRMYPVLPLASLSTSALLYHYPCICNHKTRWSQALRSLSWSRREFEPLSPLLHRTKSLWCCYRRLDLQSEACAELFLKPGKSWLHFVYCLKWACVSRLRSTSGMA